jgi:hypothetical protein
MNVCASCRQQLPGPESFCSRHHSASADGWAAVNRVMCNFLHRGVVPARLSVADRDADEREARGAAA